jgi:kynurenine formamidase
MRVIDLTHTIAESMPVYPGTEGPVLASGSSYEKDGFRETILTLFSHTGTHMDAPNHLFPHQSTLDTLPAGQFVGSALVVDCSSVGEGGLITLEHLATYGGAVEEAEFLLFYTGWSHFWGQEAYFGDYPCLDLPVIDYLIRTGKKGVGLDTIGLDPIADAQLTRHRMLFAHTNIVVIENLTNLEQLGNGLVNFMALPMKFQNSDGAPVRAIGILDALTPGNPG